MSRFTKMVSMAKTPEQVNKEVGDCPAPMTARANDVPKYPWGLCISLENEQLDALGIGKCEVGSILPGGFILEVTSYSERKTQDKTDCRAEFVITHMGVDGIEDEDEDEDRNRRAKRRYGGEKRMGDGLIDQDGEGGGELMGDQPLIGEKDYAASTSGKSTTKAVSDPGEAHLRKKNYKAA